MYVYSMYLSVGLRVLVPDVDPGPEHPECLLGALAEPGTKTYYIGNMIFFCLCVLVPVIDSGWNILETLAFLILTGRRHTLTQS